MSQPPLTARSPALLLRRNRWIASAAYLWALGIIMAMLVWHLAPWPMPASLGFWLGALVISCGPIWLCGWLARRSEQRLRRRVAAARGAVCIQCGYDLSGSGESGVCPECGVVFALDDQRWRWGLWFGELE